MEDLLDVSRVIRNEPITAAQAVGGTADGRSKKLCKSTDRSPKPAGHKVTIDLPHERMMLNGDSARLIQVFTNLLNNAAKYTENAGQINIKGELASRTEQDGQQEVIVSIHDSGIGIESETLPHLFDMFFQADRSRERRYGGLGIGLTLARSIVELHGGCIEARSDGLGKGSEFFVRLPLAKNASERVQEGIVASKHANPRSRRWSGMVLVVDDNKNQVESVSALLKILVAKCAQRMTV